MMDNKVREALLKMIRAEMPDQTIVAKVTSVTESKGVCDVALANDPDLEIYDVRLQATTAENLKGILIVPVVGSYVLINIIKNNPQAAFVSAFTEVEKVIWENESGMTLELSDRLKLNGVAHGGLVIIQNLVDRINTLENAINTHVHSGVTSGSSLSGIPTPAPITQITQKQDLENPDVVHG